MSLKVRAGEWDNRNEDEKIAVENRNVIEVIIHKDYTKGVLFYNAALLFTESSFPTNVLTIGTVCLPPPDYNPVGQQCLVSGWGKNEFEGTYQNILKKIELPAISNEECQTKLRQSKLGQSFRLHPSFLCAGGLGKDACRGDGGSPLVCQNLE
jgi:plasma kallikrein